MRYEYRDYHLPAACDRSDAMSIPSPSVSQVTISPFVRISSTRFFFNATPTTEIYTLSLHDALPILPPFAIPSAPVTALVEARLTAPKPSVVPALSSRATWFGALAWMSAVLPVLLALRPTSERSEEHTSELHSLRHLVCRLLLEKKK